MRDYRRGMRHREAIRKVWEALIAEEPYERHGAKAIAARLPFRMSSSTINWHVRALRNEHARAAAAEAMNRTARDDVSTPDPSGESSE
jgi:hypothetical protein